MQFWLILSGSSFSFEQNKIFGKYLVFEMEFLVLGHCTSV